MTQTPTPFMMRCNIPVRRRRAGLATTRSLAGEIRFDHGRRRSNRPGNSQAKGPRSGDELLESGTASWAVSTEGVIPAVLVGRRGNLSGPMTEGRALRFAGARRQPLASDRHDRRDRKFAPARRFTRCISSWAARWCRSPAMRCRCSIRPASSRNICTRAKRRGCSMSRIWARHFSAGDDPARRWSASRPPMLPVSKEGMQRYGLLLNDAGTIKDDFMFVAAARRGGALSGRQCRRPRKPISPISREKLERRGRRLSRSPSARLLALQGPLAAAVLERHSPGISKLTFMKVVRASVAGAPAIISRTGYTGEDGFEISHRRRRTPNAWRALCWASREVLPIGLGARDSLRLEAGLCLYGHDMDETTRSGRSQSRSGRSASAARTAKDFPAAEKIMDAVVDGTAQEARRHPSRRPRAGARRHRDRRQDGPHHRQDHQRRLRSQPECAHRHGLCRNRFRRGRHARST